MKEDATRGRKSDGVAGGKRNERLDNAQGIGRVRRRKKSFNKEMSLRRVLHEKGQRHNLKFALK